MLDAGITRRANSMTAALLAASTSQDASAIAERLQRSVVLVRSRAGAGAGTVWRADGLVVTNSHVVRRDHADIEGHDGRTHSARLVARDDEHDLALLQVEGATLEPVAVRDSTTLRVGEIVIAVGNPWGRRGEVTLGTILSTERPRGVPVGQRDAIYADVRLAPGNSGGPLADAEGRVVGINSMIALGMAVAIPSAAVLDLIAGNHEAQRGRLGIVVLPVSVPEAGVGLLISEVHTGSAAHTAGLIVGDVIISIDGVAGDLEALGGRLTALAPDQRVQVYLLRGGQPHTVTVVAQV
jgi:serine protease Do